MIQDEIIRIQAAKSGIKAAVYQKGVQIPETASISEYPTFINMIPTGGGGTQIIDVTNEELEGPHVVITYPRPDWNTRPFEFNSRYLMEVGVVIGDEEVGPDDYFEVQGYGTNHVEIIPFVGPRTGMEVDAFIRFYLMDPETHQDVKYVDVKYFWIERPIEVLQADDEYLVATYKENSDQWQLLRSSNTPTFNSYSVAIQGTDCFTGATTSINTDRIFGADMCASSKVNSGGIITPNFFQYCYNLNTPIYLDYLSDYNVIRVGASFLRECRRFNSKIVLPDSLQIITTHFMRACCKFNKPLTIPAGVQTIDESFMYCCYSYNQDLIMRENVTTLGIYFMAYCHSFNSKLELSPRITDIGNYFLYQCYTFDQEFALPTALKTIGSHFMDTCQAYHKTMVVPSSVTSISGYFMYKCNCFEHIDVNTSSYPSDTYSLGRDSIMRIGVWVTGANASTWKSKLADRTTSAPYRKLYLQ